MTDNKNNITKTLVWFVRADGEDMPTEANARLPRTGAQAYYLSTKNYKTIWWKSTYLHGEKRYYKKAFCKLSVNNNETLILLHSPVVYKKNISIRRIIYYWYLSKQFSKYAKKEEIPDIIISSYPSILLAFQAIKYAKKNDVPIILDLRDYWPDIFIRAFKNKGLSFAEILLYPLKRITSKMLSDADGLIGVNDDIVKWGVEKSKVYKIQNNFQTIFLGCPDPSLVISEKTREWLKETNINEEDWNICFIGSLRKTGLDLETCIKAIHSLHKKYSKIKLIVGGDGDDLKRLKNLANNSPEIVFAGWLDNNQINAVLHKSKIGMYCIQNTEDFINAFSNKAIQYLASGLPVITSLKGFSKDLLEKTGSGYYYKEGDQNELESIIEKMYLNHELYTEMSKKARALYEQQFALDIVNNQFEEFMLLTRKRYEEKNTK